MADRKLSEQADPRSNLPSTSTPGGQVAAPLDFEAFAGAGMENVTAKDMLVPRLGILQKLSPQVDPSKSEFMPGGKVGMIADLGTGELFPEGVLFLPVFYRMDYLEWAPRATKKGLVNVHSDPAILDQTTKDDKKRNVLPNGNYVAETAQFFGINLSANRRRCFIPMTSTQLKKARKWLTLANGETLTRSNGTEYQAPLFYRTWSLTTGHESNAEGDWEGWVVGQGAALHEADLPWDWKGILRNAVMFLDDLQGGKARGDLESMAREGVVDAEPVDNNGRM